MKIAIIGAGAAGCFAAANIPDRKGQEVVVFEKMGKVLQKVKVSGGGRCNVTHECFDVPELVTRYPRGKRRGEFPGVTASGEGCGDWGQCDGGRPTTTTQT